MFPILCLDFDGVIHSYTSGWKGPRNIPDPPVPGALEFIAKAVKTFEVHIYSSRSNYFFGRRAMRKWLHKNYWLLVADDADPLNVKDLYPSETRRYISSIMYKIQWPSKKPPAMITLDDRALTFNGTFPDLDLLKSFKPWNK